MSSSKKRARTLQPEKGGAKIHEHALENGLCVLVLERHLDPVVAVMLWYKTGARNEEEREAGVSHFLEHMMFKGSQRFGKGEIDRLTTQLGGTNNAFTSSDHTAYWFELASDRWEAALEIEADRMRNLLLDPAEFAAEKAVVLEELAMGEDDPWRALADLVQAALYKRHPYRRPVIGYADTLKRMTVEEMRDYYARFYHPGNATLVISGDVDPEEALELARKHFGNIPRGLPYEDADCFRPQVTEPRGEQRVRMKWDDAATRLIMVWPTTAVGQPDDYALDLASAVLSAGRMSRLHRKLVLEQGLATSISTQNDARVETGVFWVYAECAQGVAPAKLEAAIDRELESLRSELVDEATLNRCKRIIRSGEAHENETVTNLAEELGEFATDAHWKLALGAVKAVEKVESKALREVCARLLSNDRRVVGWCVPKVAEKSASMARSKPGKARTSALERSAATKTAAARKNSRSTTKKVGVAARAPSTVPAAVKRRSVPRTTSTRTRFTKKGSR